eukprot:12765-Heterococcus_DN1.PRE.5
MRPLILLSISALHDGFIHMLSRSYNTAVIAVFDVTSDATVEIASMKLALAQLYLAHTIGRCCCRI